MMYVYVNRDAHERHERKPVMNVIATPDEFLHHVNGPDAGDPPVIMFKGVEVGAVPTDVVEFEHVGTCAQYDDEAHYTVYQGIWVLDTDHYQYLIDALEKRYPSLMQCMKVAEDHPDECLTLIIYGYLNG